MFWFDLWIAAKNYNNDINNGTTNKSLMQMKFYRSHLIKY